MLDLILAYAHHLTVFTLVGLLFAEFVLVRPGIGGEKLVQLARIDLAYGLAAAFVIVAGVLRVVLGEKGMDFYLASHSFWTKMGLFVLVGLLSVLPTLRIRAWRRAVAADPSYAAPEAGVVAARRMVHVQFGFLALIPLAAAAMARGFA